MNRVLFYTALVGLIWAVLAWGAARSVYFPMRYPQGEWAEQGRAGATDVWITAADGTRLHAWWFGVEGASLVTLHLHGNAGNITHRTHLLPAITGGGSSLLLLDYRGYGKSEGKPSEKGLYQDADAAYAYLRSRGFTPNQIVLHGESLGSAVAVDLASRQDCAGLVLEAPFTSVRDVARRVLPVVGPLLAWGFDSKRKIREVKAPVLILHGTRDEVIAFEMGRALFEAAPEPKEMWVLEGATHNDIFSRAGADYAVRLRRFYETIRSMRQPG